MDGAAAEEKGDSHTFFALHTNCFLMYKLRLLLPLCAHARYWVGHGNEYTHFIITLFSSMQTIPYEQQQSEQKKCRKPITNSHTFTDVDKLYRLVAVFNKYFIKYGGLCDKVLFWGQMPITQKFFFFDTFQTKPCA